jgi:phosphatidylserine decarboxylase
MAVVAGYGTAVADDSPVTAAEANGHKPVTMELITLVANNPEVGVLLEKSIAEAKKVNPDPKTNPVQSLSDYYYFVDRSSELLPQDMLTTPSTMPMRDRMLQGICYFYFLIDQPLPELEGMGLFKNSLQYYEPFASWARDFAVTQGQYLDTEASWNEDVYKAIYNDPEFGLQTDWYESPSNWNTFNRFFARYLASPDKRPVDYPNDPSVVVAPADSVPQGIWPIDENSRIVVDGGLKVKLGTYYSVVDLLGSESEYKDAFAGGVLTHTFLNVNDYHRYHFGVGGVIKEKMSITRNVTLEVTWDGEEKKYDPIDSTGWQFYQTRGYVIVDTGEFGMVALIPMGMAQVSSVNFEDNVKVGATRMKGDMLGNFFFGGSDFIMLFQKDAGFAITAPMESKTEYKHILTGKEYGRMTSVE